MSTARLNFFWLIIFGMTMPVAVVLSTNLARRSFERVKIRDQTITVKGYAERSISADRATWSAGIVTRQPVMKDAYAELENQRKRLLAFLAEHGFKSADVDLNPVHIETQFTRDAKGVQTNTIEGYVVRQWVQIASGDVAAIAKVARDASDLIGEGIELDGNPPQYLYTKLDELKLEMLGESTKNARDRAEKLVSGSPSSLGALRSASQGVFQITPAFSTEVSDEGMNDTSSIQKIVKAVVTLEYAIE